MCGQKLALTLTLSPGERESAGPVFSIFTGSQLNDCKKNLDGGETVSLSPGERAGVRASFRSLKSREEALKSSIRDATICAFEIGEAA